ncbi:formylmethanofuran dehydrogenase, subunit B [Singulisphaera sp. GP187]|uniref:formylmethanofuran dehydrogenase subunit B n=1 Tax=Singulisphaera sp. GP187 TaxID=1882752 RepID=UPI0009284675|nr:formylmethanofuran dehydrogenase subunit B [Singulisphaera sp. GP187]SIO65967.1 formylmethanofuran dehydrogenase, subunit B [Singulisphaera sp. GP187]
MFMPQEPSLATSPASDRTVIVTDATCTACGCLCDDLIVKAEGGRIIEAVNACELGRRWYFADHAHDELPTATVDRQAVEPAVALDRAAEILSRAQAPIVLGLTRTTTETVAAALAIADRIGAVIDPDTSDGDRARLFATQRVGRVSATLGEVKNRADVVLFWGVDPVVTHPRHWERYSVEPRGRFVPDGRAGRTILVVDSTRTVTAERADQFIRVAPEAQFGTLWTLRALIQGVPLDPGRVEQATGLDLQTLKNLVDSLKAAKYGAWFSDSRLGSGPGGAARIEAALTLVRDLNRFTRFVILGLGAPGNPAGAEAALTWQTGYPSSVSLSRGSPRTMPGVTSAEALLAGGRADAALIVGDGELPGLSDAAHAHLERIPRIVVGPKATAPGSTATVAFDAATPGIDAGGTVMRSDGVVLPLRPPLHPSTPTDREWLQALETRLPF